MTTRNESAAGIAGALLDWLGTCPALEGLPLAYGHLPPRTGLMLAPRGGAGRVRSFIDGGFEAGFPFRLVLRMPTSDSAERLAANERLLAAADWAAQNWQSLSLGGDRQVRAVRTESGPAIGRPGENGAQDLEVTFNLIYEVN